MFDLWGAGQRAQAPAPPPPTEEPVVIQRVNRTCPECRGKGKVRDTSLLPWNNMASFAIILGISGVIGSAYLDANRKALLIAGVVSGAIGLVLYVMGDSCPRCEGMGNLDGIAGADDEDEESVRITWIPVVHGSDGKTRRQIRVERKRDEPRRKKETRKPTRKQKEPSAP